MSGRCRTALVASALLLAACATSPSEPVLLDRQARAERLVIDEVIVDVAVLGRTETIRELGVDLEAVGVQPVWIRVVSDRDGPVWLTPLSLDQDCWAPVEVRCASIRTTRPRPRGCAGSWSRAPYR